MRPCERRGMRWLYSLVDATEGQYSVIDVKRWSAPMSY